MSIDVSVWAERLAELARTHKVPGASLAVLVDGERFATATGVLNLETKVDVTTDSLFQIGSITKPYTATVVVGLADQGRLDLDAPVVEVLPEFRVADPEVSAQITPRHLLTHTSGIAGDCFEDTGRGDDALERYVERCAELGQDVPLGVTMSYCNTGYCILGRIIERLTGEVWETAMQERLLDPLGLTHTVTLPEQALRFRTAWGHLEEDGEPPSPAPSMWLARALAPAGSICATATDLLRFAQLHLDGGLTGDGTRLLSTVAVTEMRQPLVEVPDRWATGDHWGLGWALQDWGDDHLYGHDGNTTGQNAYLTVVPEQRVAIALLTNVASAAELQRQLQEELLEELCGIETPPWPQPVETEAIADGNEILGSYQRYGVELEVERNNGDLQAIARIIEPLASQLPDEDNEPITMPVRPSNNGDGVYVGRFEEEGLWWPLVFFEIEGERYLHTGARAQRRVG